MSNPTPTNKPKLLLLKTPIRAARSRAEYGGLPAGAQASAHNWPDCK